MPKVTVFKLSFANEATQARATQLYDELHLVTLPPPEDPLDDWVFEVWVKISDQAPENWQEIFANQTASTTITPIR